MNEQQKIKFETLSKKFKLLDNSKAKLKKMAGMVDRDENLVSTITKEVSRNLDNFFQIYQKLNEDEKLKYDEFMKKTYKK